MARFTLLLFLILFPIVADAQASAPLFTLDSLKTKSQINLVLENWRFHAGDDAQWAVKNFNDSSWLLTDTYIDIEKGQDREMGFKGLGWFRYHFRTDSSLNDVPLAIFVEQRGASEIYLDGRLVTKLGRFGGKKPGIYINPHIPFTFQLKDPGAHVLAVKYENYHTERKMSRTGEDMGGFMIAVSTASSAINNYKGSAFISALFLLTSAGIFLALFIAHLILYLFYRQVRSNLIFSIFNLGLAVLFFNIFIGLHNPFLSWELWITPMVNVALCISCFALSALVNDLFSKRNIRFMIIASLCFLVAIVSFFYFRLASYMLVGLGVICSVEASVSVIIAIRKRVPGARILGAGILFLCLFVTVIFTIALIKGGLQLHGGFAAMLVLALSIMALFSIPISMSAYLAWTFARVNKHLKGQLVKVEELSAIALEQEQEKQRLLESRKEELEDEVAHRTSEVRMQRDQIEQQHNALKAEKQKSDTLLLNILPAEVAEELKESGHAKARHFDHVTVLFTDFVNFTQIAEQLSPEVLVEELHECFRVFDDIMSRYGLEKIKTIGDAYLAVSGLPQYNADHARNTVAAALEILAFVNGRTNPGTPFEIRIGIHSGSLVAGIVGVKKFAYDIWGDTVNTASRMESNSLPGKVNISETTYQLVKDFYVCTHRGKISAKNKGEMDMYFVDHIIQHSQ